VAFPTLGFAYFFAFSLTAMVVLRGHWRAQKASLLAASYIFYAAWDVRLLLVLLGISILDWGLAEAILSARGNAARRWWLGIAIFANIGLLCFFKLYDFLRDSSESLARLLGLSAHLPVLEILIPVGVSFYAFQGLAYVVDAYRGSVYRAQSLLDFLLFMGFFPKLLAGPICRSKELLPQFARPTPITEPDVSQAVALIVTGLFKKVVLASVLANRLVDDAFLSPDHYAWYELLLAVYAYSVQLYLDFSGYTDMARGLALLLGLRLPENFAYPYAATNLGEYWRRWHMTFSTWLRDYVYFPLGGSRCSPPRAYFNLFVTFLVCGIWHGSDWRFVLWGGAHGVALAAYRASLDFRKSRGIDPARQQRGSGAVFVAWAATLTFCAFARIPFKSPDVQTAGTFLSTMMTASGGTASIDPVVVGVTLLGIAMNFFGRPVFTALVRFHAYIPTLYRPAAWIAVGTVLLALNREDVAPYIYFGF
jgi:D-alanyl-lipoteichoic acid acyltransferase DltB (MBOAT superfamily)